uniref:tetratricopeptide repeat protein n=1 Tax=Ningiella ruwaisensis TaxID=2364274 RepID=UPI001447280F|nr:tetratricopeptide repeat protein [Ningiella ruwaisensis]
MRASREKLEAAMLAAGFDTQSQLADAIAQHENLEKPPKDLVSKVFREQPVSTHNLARIAHALGVEAHTVYLSKDVPEFAELAAGSEQNNVSVPPVLMQSEPTQPGITKIGANRHIGYIAFLLLISLVLAYFFFFSSQNEQGVEESALHGLNDANGEFSPPKAILGDLRVLILGVDNAGLFLPSLQRFIDHQSNINAIIPSSDDLKNIGVYTALDKWKAHLVIEISRNTGRYFDELRVRVVTDKMDALLFHDLVYSLDVIEHQDVTFSRIFNNLRQFLDSQPWQIGLSENSQANLHYQNGLRTLFTGSIAPDFDAAEAYFSQAIVEDAQFADAYSQKCRAIVRKSYVNEAPDMLEQAALDCYYAKQLASTSETASLALAELYIHSNRIDDAQDLLNPLITQAYPSSDALELVSLIHFLRFRESAQVVDAETAVAFAKKAIERNPFQWRAHNTLGRLYLRQGDIESSIQSFKQATQTTQNEIILSNLGVMQLCQGSTDDAEMTFTRLNQTFPDNYLGYEQLGSLYYFEGKLKNALDAKLAAIGKMPNINIHQVWASIADIYLALGESELASQNYEKALTLLEKDELLGITDTSDEVHKRFYKWRLLSIKDESKLQAHLQNQLSTSLESIFDHKEQLSSGAQRHLAQMFSEQGENDKATELWQALTERCPIYASLRN